MQNGCKKNELALSLLLMNTLKGNLRLHSSSLGGYVTAVIQVLGKMFLWAQQSPRLWIFFSIILFTFVGCIFTFSFFPEEKARTQIISLCVQRRI